jgi:hypothetical protein
MGFVELVMGDEWRPDGVSCVCICGVRGRRVLRLGDRPLDAGRLVVPTEAEGEPERHNLPRGGDGWSLMVA